MSKEAREAFEQAMSGKQLTDVQKRIAWQVFYPRWICETRAKRDAAGEFDVKPYQYPGAR